MSKQRLDSLNKAKTKNMKRLEEISMNCHSEFNYVLWGKINVKAKN